MKFWYFLGRLSYYLLWPGISLYLLNSERTRILVICGNRIIVVKAWLGDGKWSLPGGGLHKGEEIIAGAVREVLEETGVELTTNQIKVLKSERFKRSGVPMQLYYCSVQLEATKPTKITQAEIIDVKWIEFDQLSNVNTSKDALRALAIWKAR